MHCSKGELAAPKIARQARLRVAKLVAKIGDANGASLALFEAALGFARVSHCDVFLETTLELRLTEPAIRALESPLADVCVLLEPPRSTSRRDPAAPAMAMAGTAMAARTTFTTRAIR